MNRRAFGNAGEQAACDYLARRGWTILQRNYRRPTGEIDIIARRRGLIAFIEVKRRSSLKFGAPAEAVTLQKQRHIARTASLYMQENELENARVRFDVIEILPEEIRHIEGAFDASGLF